MATLYLQQLAWLHANKNRTECEQPPLDDYSRWLIATLFRIGIGTGDAAVSYIEIAAWCELAGIELGLWELESIRTLSITYWTAVHYYGDKEHKNELPPYTTDEGRDAWMRSIAEQRRLMLMMRK